MNGAQVLGNLLAVMRASRFILHTAHWQAEAGAGFFGRHQVLSRAYTELDEDIDVLAEKMVALYGVNSVNADVQLNKFNRISSMLLESTSNLKDNPMKRAEFIQRALLVTLSDTYEDLKNNNDLTLGMDDFIMASHNKYQNTYYLILRSI